MKKTATQVVKSFQRVESERTSDHNIWREVHDYTVPQKSKYFLNYAKSSGLVETYDNLKYIYDNIGSTETIKTASSFSSFIINPHGDWFNLEPSRNEQKKEEIVNRALSRITDQAHSELRHTNFYQNVPENFLDLTTIGNSGYVIETPKEGPILYFTPKDMYSLYWEEDFTGTPSVFWSTFSLTAFQLASHYLTEEEYKSEGKFIQKLGKPAWEAFKADDFTTTFKVIHHAYPITPELAHSTELLKKKFYSQHVMVDNPEVFLKDTSLNWCPYGTFRGFKIADTQYGIGQGTLALPNIKTQQKIARSTILSAQKTVEPPIEAPASKKYLKFYGSNPNQINPVNSSRGERITTFGDFRLQGIFEFFVNHRNIIRDIFHGPELQVTRSQYETARATAVNAEASLKVLTPIVTRLERETFTPIVSQVISAMNLRKKELGLEKDFETLSEVNYKVRFSSELSMAQRQKKLQNFVRGIDFIHLMSKENPDAKHKLNYNRAIEKVWDYLNSDLDTLNTEEESLQLREQEQTNLQAELDALRKERDANNNKIQSEANRNQAQADQMQAQQGLEPPSFPTEEVI